MKHSKKRISATLALLTALITLFAADIPYISRAEGSNEDSLTTPEAVLIDILETATPVVEAATAVPVSAEATAALSEAAETPVTETAAAAPETVETPVAETSTATPEITETPIIETATATSEAAETAVIKTNTVTPEPEETPIVEASPASPMILKGHLVTLAKSTLLFTSQKCTRKLAVVKEPSLAYVEEQNDDGTLLLRLYANDEIVYAYVKEPTVIVLTDAEELALSKDKLAVVTDGQILLLPAVIEYAATTTEAVPTATTATPNPVATPAATTAAAAGVPAAESASAAQADRVIVNSVLSTDGKSIIINRPSVSGIPSSFSFSYTLWDDHSNRIAYFYSTESRVAVTCPYDGKFVVYVGIYDGSTTLYYASQWFTVSAYSSPAKPLTIGAITQRMSPNGKSLYINKPVVSGGHSSSYTFSYTIWDSNGNRINYFYSNAKTVAATCPYNGRFIVYIGVFDGADTLYVHTDWFDVNTYAELTATVGKSRLSSDGLSIFVDKPAITNAASELKIAYNLYDAEGNAVNYFYSNAKTVALTPNQNGKYVVIIVVSDGTHSVTISTPWYVISSSPVLYNGVMYKLLDDGAHVVGWSGDEVTLSIPPQLYGVPVVAIDDKTFLNNTRLTDITIPSSVQHIGSRAFSGTAINTLIVPDKLVSLGSNAFAGLPQLAVLDCTKDSPSYKLIHQQGLYCLCDITCRALLIGQAYTGTSSQLNSTVSDANAIKNCLAGMKQLSFTSTVKTDLTASQIISAINSTFASADENDISLLFYSGHGSSGGLLIGTDFYAISPSRLQSVLDQIPGRKIVWVDACYSGAIIGKNADGSPLKDGGGNFASSFVSAFSGSARDLANNDYTVIAASSGSQVSWEGTIDFNGAVRQMGYFTWGLTYGCGWNYAAGNRCAWYADANQDNILSLFEVATYTRSKVSAISNNQQTVQYYPSSGASNIWIGR